MSWTPRPIWPVLLNVRLPAPAYTGWKQAQVVDRPGLGGAARAWGASFCEAAGADGVADPRVPSQLGGWRDGLARPRW